MSTEQSCCCVGYVIYLVGFLAYLVGIAVPYWYELDWAGSIYKVYTGVFTTCQEYLGETDCGRVKLEDQVDWWQGAAALLIIAGLLGLIAGFTSMWVPVTSGLQIFAGLAGGVGSIIYVAKIDGMEQEWGDILSLGGLLDTDWNFLWGFYLALGGATLLFFNGVGLAIMSCCCGCSMRPICCCCGGHRSR